MHGIILSSVIDLMHEFANISFTGDYEMFQNGGFWDIWELSIQYLNENMNLEAIKAEMLSPETAEEALKNWGFSQDNWQAYLDTNDEKLRH